MKRSLLFALTVLACTAAAPVYAEAAATLRVATTGTDDVGCGAAGDECATIDFAVGEASAGDTVKVNAGTYPEYVDVDKTISLIGPNAELDPRSAVRGAEAIITTGGIHVRAADVEIDGLTVQNVLENPNGGGIVTSPDYGGYLIENNIVTDNGIGVYPGSAPSSDPDWGPNVIQKNLITANNDPWAAGGTGIYSQFGAYDWTIQDNVLSGNDNSAIILTGVQENITIDENLSVGGGSFGVLISTTNLDVTNNTISGSPYSAIYLGGSNVGVDIRSNSVSGGSATAVTVDSSYGGPNSGVTIEQNHLANNARGIRAWEESIAGEVEVHGNRIVGSSDTHQIVNYDVDNAIDAENNWWGCNTGCATSDGLVDADPSLQLTQTSTYNTIQPGQSTLLISSFSTNPDNGYTGPIFDSQINITQSGSFGTFTPSVPNAITPDGNREVVVEFIGSSEGTQVVNAVLDNETVAQNIVVDDSAPDQTTEIVPPGGDASTGGADSGDSTGTTVTSPTGGLVTIYEDGDDYDTPPVAGDYPGTGYAFFGEHVHVTAPDALNAQDPIVLDFELYLPGIDPADVQIFRNGVLIPACDVPGAGEAVQSPCVDDLTPDAGAPAPGVIAIRVLTVQASVFSFALESVPPEVTITGAQAIYDHEDPDFDFEVSDADPSSEGLLVECQLLGEAPHAHGWRDCDDSDATWQADGIDAGEGYTGLNQRDYVLEVRVTDAAGNVSDVASHSFRVDSVAPQVFINSGPADNSAQNSQTAVFGFSFSDQSESSGVAVTCKIDALAAQPCGSGAADGPVSGSGSTSPDYTGLSAGVHTFTLKATDGAGHSDTKTRTFFVDIHEPDTTIVSGPADPTNSTAANFTFSSDDSDGPSSSPDYGPIVYECKLDGALTWTLCPTPPNFTVGEGNHTLLVRAKDPAGNADSTPASYSWMVDLTKPTISNTGFPEQNGRYVTASDKEHKANYSCTDPISNGVASGIATCTGSVPSGSEIDRSGGTDGGTAKTFTINSTDNATNAAIPTVVNYKTFTFKGLILDDQPLAYWRMGDGTGSDVMEDETGSYDGEYKNGQQSGPVGISGDGDHARKFTGEQGYGYVNGIEAPSEEYTMAAWVKLYDLDNDGKADDGQIMQHGGGGAIWVDDEKVNFLAVDWDRGNEVVSPGILNENTWYHVAGSWDGDTSRLYIDGTLVASKNSVAVPSGKATFYVGYGDKAPWLKGQLDEVAYFAHDLSAKSVKEEYLADPAPPADTPVTPTDGGGSVEPTGTDAPDAGTDEPQQGDNPGGGEPRGNYETTGAEDQPGTTDDAIENAAAPMDPAGMWTRSSDKSVLEIVAKRKGWIGKTVVTAARKAKKGRKAKAAAKKRCGLRKGYKTIALSERKAGGYKGTIADPVKADGKCRTRKSPFTATLSEDGTTLTLTKRRGGKKTTETLTRSTP